MKRVGLTILVVAALLASCSDKNKLPENVLPHAKMQAVMWDIIRANDYLNNYVFYKDPATDKLAESEKWNNKVFEFHKITRQQFKISYEYYQQHPLLMKALMDSIGKIKVEEKRPETAKPVVDSTRKPDLIRKKMDSLTLRSKIERLRKLSGKTPVAK